MNIGQAVIFIILAAIAGYVFGLIDHRFTASLRNRNEKPAPVPKPVVVQHNRPGEHTVLEVTIDNASCWHLELDGTRLDDPAATPVDRRQRLIDTIVHIRPWLDGKPLAASPAQAAPAAAAVPAPAPAPRTVSPTPQVQPSSAFEAPRLNAARGLGSMIAGEPKPPVEARPASIVSMIDDILQTQLASSPLRSRGIKLEENPGGGVVVRVGTQSYDGIDGVPDPEVRSAIKAAIAEWNKNR